VEVAVGPGPKVRWGRRSLWELSALPRLARAWGADVAVMMSGVVHPALSLPQVCLACNPRPLTAVPFREPEQRVKHRVQRWLYRESPRRAALTVFNSEHLRGLYRRNGMPPDARTVVVPHGLPAGVFAAAEAATGTRRRAFETVAASVWSPYKGPETLIEAVRLLREEDGVPAELVLAGPWPDPAYERHVRRLAAGVGGGAAVRVTGYLSDGALHAAYARARVFCLPSHTESFGLPALEAQAFGTPVVGSSTTAMPEVCGAGGLYAPPGDPRALRPLLRAVLTDTVRWGELSAAARANAQGYTWARSAAPLVELLHRAAAGQRAAPAERRQRALRYA